MGPGRLYVCPTPIGNLEDITLRVLRVLQEVDVIAAEDTRRTRQLLNHFEIATPLVSLHEHNEEVRTADLIRRLQGGESVALVSDAGMPGISDPGEIFIRAVVEADIPLTVLPGPAAFVTALVGSGLPTERFLFEGFLPRHVRRRRERLERLRGDDRTLLFYEAPHRLRETLKDMLAVFGDRPTCVAREMTKAYEQWQRGTMAEVAAYWFAHPPRGEYVIVVAGAPSSGDAAIAESSVDGEPAQPTVEQIVRLVQEQMDAGIDKKTAVREVARQLGMPRRTVYKAATSLSAKFPDRIDDDE